MSTLMPELGLVDWPHTLRDAVRFALVVISWDSLLDEDQPPREIWLNGDALKAHFDEVRKRWKERAEGKGDSSGGGGGTERNAAADALIVE